MTKPSNKPAVPQQHAAKPARHYRVLKGANGYTGWTVQTKEGDGWAGSIGILDKATLERQARELLKAGCVIEDTAHFRASDIKTT